MHGKKKGRTIEVFDDDIRDHRRCVKRLYHNRNELGRRTRDQSVMDQVSVSTQV